MPGEIVHTYKLFCCLVFCFLKKKKNLIIREKENRVRDGDSRTHFPQDFPLLLDINI